jgi:DNA polymerase-3 subunit epsilon
MRFAAIDFETANYSRDSACAVGLVVVDRGRIVDRAYWLIRPPTREFIFTYIHGLTWQDVRNAPTFADLWPELRKRIGSVEFLAAHNAPFDSGVLISCCSTYRLAAVRQPFVCTMRVAREVWEIYPTRLPDVCARLRIPLRHHHADSDAEACARIVLAAEKAGWAP